MWRVEFPAHIQSSLITAECPRGTLLISDLELAGIIAHNDVLAQAGPTCPQQEDYVGCRRQPRLGAVGNQGVLDVDYRPRILADAMHQRTHRYVACHHYLPASLNRMADDASRLWNLSDANLLTHFNSHYAQTVCRELRHLAPQMSLSLIGALSRQRCTPVLCAAPQFRSHLLAPLDGFLCRAWPLLLTHLGPRRQNTSAPTLCP
jgi:hypothetical protein